MSKFPRFCAALTVRSIATWISTGHLDELWNIFGPERLIYGSDWPNSDHWGSYAEVLSVVREYFTGKGRPAAEKFFWKNSIDAYRWVMREASQPSAKAESHSREPTSRSLGRATR